MANTGRSRVSLFQHKARLDPDALDIFLRDEIFGSLEDKAVKSVILSQSVAEETINLSQSRKDIAEKLELM